MCDCERDTFKNCMFFIFSVHGNMPISGGGRGGGGEAQRNRQSLLGSRFLRSAKTPPRKAMCRHVPPVAPRIVSDPAAKRKKHNILSIARAVFE